MKTLRTAETQQKYVVWQTGRTESDGCILCQKEPIKLFTYWKIIPNDFPYDRVSRKQDMIVPLRHVKEEDLTQEERDELQKLKETVINEDYTQGFIMEATLSTKSVPAHFHLQLMLFRDSLYQD